MQRLLDILQVLLYLVGIMVIGAAGWYAVTLLQALRLSLQPCAC